MLTPLLTVAWWRTQVITNELAPLYCHGWTGSTSTLSVSGGAPSPTDPDAMALNHCPQYGWRTCSVAEGEKAGGAHQPKRQPIQFLIPTTSSPPMVAAQFEREPPGRVLAIKCPKGAQPSTHVLPRVETHVRVETRVMTCVEHVESLGTLIARNNQS